MKLSHADLISPIPYRTNIGSIKSPTLREIWELGYDKYNLYLRFLLLTPNKYCSEKSALHEWYYGLSDDDRQHVTILDICTIDKELAVIMHDILNFFFVETVEWDRENEIFILKDEYSNEIRGVINNKIINNVINVICQLNGLSIDENVDKIKNKKAKNIMEKLLAGRKKMQQTQTSNKDNELDNLVSSVANKHPNLNIINIWDLTISQFWDAFRRMVNNSIYDLSFNNVSVWGNESKQFKINDWYSNITN